MPISAFEIATKMGVSVIPYSAYNERTQNLMLKKSEDGFVVEKTNGSFFIFYKDEKGYGRINNTIMHEIGHIILEHTEDSELADKEVKFFAKYALAPPVKALYSPYHEMDIRHFADKMNELYNKEKPETNLKIYRKRANLSQKELAELADIPVRMIQHYEQRQKNINKAQVEYLARLSRVLNCNIEELLELVEKE